MPNKRYNVCVVGVGAVGIEMLRILKERDFPIGELKVFARSSREIVVSDNTYCVDEITADGFKDIDIALFAGTEGEKGAAVTFAPEAIKKGATVIDNGADFRMDPDVPLVVPEVNAEDLKKHNGLIASPNCSTTQMVVALWPIHKVAGIERVIVCSYQAVSGVGRGGFVQLERELQSESELQGGSALEKAFAYRIAKNVIPQIGGFGELDYTSEEWKMVHETHKIMHDKKIKISATCVRVPVVTGHSEAIYLETKKSISVEKVRKLLSESPGVIVLDKPPQGVYPLPIVAEGKDEVFIGRIREDPFTEKGLWLWVVSDNLRKGAALNAVQIAELVVKAKD